MGGSCCRLRQESHRSGGSVYAITYALESTRGTAHSLHCSGNPISSTNQDVQHSRETYNGQSVTLPQIIVQERSNDFQFTRAVPAADGRVSQEIVGRKELFADGKFESPDACEKTLTSDLTKPITTSVDDEDFCPTCLEGYEKQNPKIITLCKHHYHLSCILEWMERSNTCPTCDQEMIFHETN